MQIAMIGTGYVGLVTGTCLAEIGHNVICVDVDEKKVNQLKDGVSPIFEPGLSDMMRQNIKRNRLQFTTEIQEALKACDCAFIAVGTPEGEDGSADLQYVSNVAKSIGDHASHSFMVVVKSTVPVGTGDKVESIIRSSLEARGARHSITVASNPEFLKEGDAIQDFMRPDRIVVGVGSDAEEEVFKNLYKPFILDDPSKLIVMDRKSSELTKYGSNAMLATRISFMNNLSQLCEALGADIDNIRRGMGADPRIGRKFLYAGPGYGGSCFPKDVKALQRTGREFGVDLEVVEAVSAANERQKSHAAQKILNHFSDLSDKTIAIWGLAFKPGTDDIREAPALTIIQKLLERGAQVVGHDPEAIETFSRAIGNQPGLRYEKDAYETLNKADALVLVTEWSEYRRPDWGRVESKLNQKVIFDLRNQYEPEKLMKQGFHYECIGRPDSRIHP